MAEAERATEQQEHASPVQAVPPSGDVSGSEEQGAPGSPLVPSSSDAKPAESVGSVAALACVPDAEQSALGEGRLAELDGTKSDASGAKAADVASPVGGVKRDARGKAVAKPVGGGKVHPPLKRRKVAADASPTATGSKSEIDAAAKEPKEVDKVRSFFGLNARSWDPDSDSLASTPDLGIQTLNLF